MGDADAHEPPLDRRKLKKAKKLLAKGSGTPEQALAVYGNDAVATIELMPARDDRPPDRLLPVEVQNVLLWALTHDKGQMPKWIRVNKKPLLRGALVVLAPQMPASCAPRLASHTAPRLVKLPRAHEARLASSWATELLQVALPRKRKAAALAAEAPVADPAHVGRCAQGWLLEYVRSFAASEQELLKS